jgi:hypothetical protein
LSVSGVLTGTSVPDSGAASWISGIVRQNGPAIVRAQMTAGYWNFAATVPIAVRATLTGF